LKVMRRPPLYRSSPVTRTNPTCALPVQCVPPQGEQSKSPTITTRTSSVTLGARRRGSVASVSASGKNARTGTSASTMSFTRASARARSASRNVSPGVSMVQAVSPRRDEIVSAPATSTSARESICCPVCSA
jgi:hypothetical protein